MIKKAIYICRNRTFYLPLYRQKDNDCRIDKEKR